MSLSEQRKEGVSAQKCKAASPEPSCLSMKSDMSMDPPPKLSDGVVTSGPDNTASKMSLNVQRKNRVSVRKRKAASPEPSCVSVKSDASMDRPPEFSDGAVTFDPDNTASKMSLNVQRKNRVSVRKHKAASPEPSCVSVKSHASMDRPPEFSDGAVTFDPERQTCHCQSLQSREDFTRTNTEAFTQAANKARLDFVKNI